MPNMSVTFDTSHLEMSTLSEVGTPSKNNQFISVTAETSQDPIGPCRPLEQSEDSCRHSLMAAWRPGLDFGVHSVVRCYCRGDTVGVSVGIMIRVRDWLSLLQGTLETQAFGPQLELVKSQD